MAAIRYKELLGWYVITLKLRETVESRLPQKSTYASKIVPDHEPRPPKSEWVISIEEKLAQGSQENMPSSWAKLSIYQIPRHLKHGEDKAWVPQIVSLGPYHHNEQRLCHMERHKWRCLHRILERSGQGIALYLDSMKKSERRARAYYEERISMTCDEFVEMMVLDGCFVIKMFKGFAEGFEELGYPPNDPLFSMRESILQIQRDMIMLENQIPLFILDQLLGLQLGDPNQKGRVTKLALQFFSPLIYGNEAVVRGDTGIDEGEYQRLKFNLSYDHGKVHCLEVVRRSLLHLGLKRSKRPKTKRWLQRRKQLTFCLSDLREAGIQIKRRSSNCWGHIHFKNGILEIPPIEIHEGTRSLLLNLIAFEQSHFNCSHYITSYVIFMHNLINSSEDVRYLCNQRIIVHFLGSNAEVADLFHRLCQEVAFDKFDSYLLDINVELEEYYYIGNIPSFATDTHPTCCANTRLHLDFIWRMPIAFLTCNLVAQQFLTRKWNAWKAILRNKYFDNPWSIISLIAAFVLLVLTCIQSFYAVYAYYRPWS